MKTLVYLEVKNGELKATSLEALSLAQKITQNNKEKMAAVLVAPKNTLENTLSSLEAWGLSTVYLTEGEGLENYHYEQHTEALVKAMEAFGAELLLANASSQARDFLPRAAVRMKAALVSDLVSCECENQKITKMIKPLYAGKVLSELTFSEAAEKKLISLRSKAFAVQNNMSPSSFETVSLTLKAQSETSLKISSVETSKQESLDLSEADMIVSGGRALGSLEKFSLIHDSAKKLGATAGASRAAVDSGFAAHDMQVGQTGKTVSPKLYIACGISGSIQHMAGMRTSKIIVAINTDPEAPIFSVADYGIVGDLFTALPMLVDKLSQMKAEL